MIVKNGIWTFGTKYRGWFVWKRYPGTGTSGGRYMFQGCTYKTLRDVKADIDRRIETGNLV